MPLPSGAPFREEHLMKPIKTIPAFIPALALALGMATFGWAGMAHADDHGAMSHHGTMHVTKSPTCGCCSAWVALARQEGYDIEVTDTADVTTVKLIADIPGHMWACHTATVHGYVVEGHVPFEALAMLLEARPKPPQDLRKITLIECGKPTPRQRLQTLLLRYQNTITFKTLFKPLCVLILEQQMI